MVANTYGYIGMHSGSTGGVTVAGTSSRWKNHNDLHVGCDGTGTLNVTDGGVVANTMGLIGPNTSSTGEVTVTGADSQWNNSSHLFVGLNGSGVLRIENGGVVTNMHGYIGKNSNATGEATISGTGSKWSNSGFLFVGNFGTGTLNIKNAGMVVVSDTVKLLPGGTINLDGGTLDTGILDLTNEGTFNMTGGFLPFEIAFPLRDSVMITYFPVEIELSFGVVLDMIFM